jgi:NADPH:quinone reductase-like Zn-dependent oxidoreductase
MMAMMKAVRVHEFGGPEVLVYEDVPRPVPGPGEVLVRVHAAGVNPPDWYRRVGYTNFPEELRPPAPPLPFIPGSDVSGTVAAVGPQVTAFREGDAVFGLVRFPSLDNAAQGYAEYVTSPVEHLALKPETVDHVHAAGVPMAGLTAYQFLFDHVRLGWDKRVLVNGAGGGVGHFLVQLAKTRRAHVIGVASGRHEAFLRGMGVDRFVDYTTTSPGETVRDVDHVFDTVGGPDGHPVAAGAQARRDADAGLLRRVPPRARRRTRDHVPVGAGALRRRAAGRAGPADRRRPAQGRDRRRLPARGRAGRPRAGRTRAHPGQDRSAGRCQGAVSGSAR